MISIKDVPAYICENCGEAYFTPEISRKIDEVMRDFHGTKNGNRTKNSPKKLYLNSWKTIVYGRR